MHVETIIIVLIVIVIALIYLLSRGNADKPGIRDNKASLDKLSSGSTAARESIDRIKSDFDKLSVNTESAIKRTEDISQNNTDAAAGISNALDILERAKDRDNADKDI